MTDLFVAQSLTIDERISQAMDRTSSVIESIVFSSVPVAVAIAIGGPGATVWMIIAGSLGMSSKVAECTLGVKYRRTRPDGTVSGGRCTTSRRASPR